MGRYLCLSWFVLVIRLLTYFLVWALMAGYAQEYVDLAHNAMSESSKEEITCATLYQGGLMLIQAIIETCFLGLIIYYVIRVRAYLLS